MTKKKNDTIKHFGLTVDPELHGKIKYISEYEGRSMNWLFIHIIRQFVFKFEKKHGTINYNSNDENK